MQFAIGSAALGTAHLFNGKLVRGVLVAAPGRVVDVGRPPAPARAGRARGRGRVPLRARARGANRAVDASSSLVKPIGLVVVAFIAVFAVSQGAKSLGLPSLTLGSVQAELDATTRQHRSRAARRSTTAATRCRRCTCRRAWSRCCCGRSRGRCSGSLQILASLEGIALAGFIVSGGSRSRSRCDICGPCRSCSIAGRSRSSTPSRSRRSPTSVCSTASARSCCPRSTCCCASTRARRASSTTSNASSPRSRAEFAGRGAP